MFHKRAFVGARSDEILSALFGLAFCGKGGLMIDATAEREDVSSDGTWRVITGFRPMGNGVGSFLGISFNVRQELIDCSRRPDGAIATIRMSFSPHQLNDTEPVGSFLWRIEAGGAIGQERAFWSESINTDETAGLGIPVLRIKTGSQWIFRVSHNRLVQKAAFRIAHVLSHPGDRPIDFAEYARHDGLSFWPAKCGSRF
jgi:hypothetical protein